MDRLTLNKYFLVIYVHLLFLFACSKGSDGDNAKYVSEIEAVSAARAKAFNEGNAAVIASKFTEDGVLMAPGAPASVGRAAVERYYQSIFDEYDTQLESGYEEVEVSGDMAYGRGYAKVKLVPRGGGDTIFSTAKYINILRRQPDGQWLTTHDIWNGNE